MLSFTFWSHALSVEPLENEYLDEHSQFICNELELRHFVACGEDVKFLIHLVMNSEHFDSPGIDSRILLHPTRKCSPHMEPNCYRLKMLVLLCIFMGFLISPTQ